MMPRMFDDARPRNDVRPADPTGIDAAEALAASVRRMERRLRALEEMTAIGLDLTRALHRRVLAADPVGDEAVYGNDGGCEYADYLPPPPIPRPSLPQIDPAAAFAKLSRAVRLTLQLEARTDEALRALIAGEAQETQVRRETTRPEAKRQSGEAPEAKPRDRDDEEVDRPVTEAPDREVETDMESARLLAALQERLEDDAAYQGREDRPIRETVEALRRDLDLGPDGSPWTGEGWEEPPPGAQPPRPRGSAFPHPGRQGFPIGDRAAQVRAPEPAARPPPRAAHPARRE
jgi:hypothetical protein